jgi:hypothetical protein
MKGFIGLAIQVFLGILDFLGNPARIELKKKKIDIKQSEKAKNAYIEAENIKQKLLKEQTQTSNQTIKQERKTDKGPLIGRFKRKRENND